MLSHADLRRAFELRYQVYCVDYRFLHPRNYPDGIETDEYDEQAAHFIERDAQGLVCGYVRLVPADKLGNFPFRVHCPVFDAAHLPSSDKSGEVSRLVVRKDCRGDSIVAERLYRQVYVHSCTNGMRFWYAAMERRLARRLGRRGYLFRKIGPETNYYGVVNLYLADLRENEERVDPALVASYRAGLQ